jgi:hypothetical protein
MEYRQSILETLQHHSQYDIDGWVRHPGQMGAMPKVSTYSVCINETARKYQHACVGLLQKRVRFAAKRVEPTFASRFPVLIQWSCWHICKNRMTFLPSDRR